MKVIYIDTSVVINEFFFRSAYSQAFLKACAILNVSVCIPDVVVDEVVGNYPKRLRAAHVSFRKAHDNLAKLIAMHGVHIQIDEAIDDFDETFHVLLDDNNVNILDYPDVPAKELVEESYNQKKPFKDSGEGHKDYLIWRTLKDHMEGLSGDDEPSFLTSNTKDFCSSTENKKFDLHPDLKQQLDESVPQLKVHTSMKSAFESELAPHLEGLTLEDLPELSSEELNAATISYLENRLSQYSAYGFEEVPFSNDVSITGTGEIEITDVSLKKIVDEVVITITGHAEVEAFGFIEKHSFYFDEMPEQEVSVDDPNWNDHVMSVTKYVSLPFELSAFYSTDSKQITDFELNMPSEIHDDFWQ